MKPTQAEAFAAIGDVLYAIEQCLAHHVFVHQVQSVLENHRCESTQFIRNATLESSLLFVRKLNEFFGKHKQSPTDDTLRAFHFGDFPANGWFLDKKEYDELHLYVAHLSVEGVRNGKKSWPMDDYVGRALDKSLLFLDFLEGNPDTPECWKLRLRNLTHQINQVTKRLKGDSPQSIEGGIGDSHDPKQSDERDRGV